MAAIGGASREGATSVMFEGEKHRESSALTDGYARVPDVLKYLRMKHEMGSVECNAVVTRLVTSGYKKNSSKLS